MNPPAGAAFVENIEKNDIWRQKNMNFTGGSYEPLFGVHNSARSAGDAQNNEPRKRFTGIPLVGQFWQGLGVAPRAVSSTTFSSQRARMMSRRRHRDDQELSDEPREVHMNSHVLSL